MLAASSSLVFLATFRLFQMASCPSFCPCIAQASTYYQLPESYLITQQRSQETIHRSQERRTSVAWLHSWIIYQPSSGHVEEKAFEVLGVSEDFGQMPLVAMSSGRLFSPRVGKSSRLFPGTNLVYVWRYSPRSYLVPYLTAMPGFVSPQDYRLSLNRVNSLLLLVMTPAWSPSPHCYQLTLSISAGGLVLYY